MQLNPIGNRLDTVKCEAAAFWIALGGGIFPRLK
jgi:hypothetical protein